MNTDTLYTVYDHIDIGSDVWLETSSDLIGYRITAIGADYIEVTLEPTYNQTGLVAPECLYVNLSDLYLDVDSMGNPTLNFEL
jgi:hypothetical protein